MFFLSSLRAAPPKLKRNNFFPWTNFVLNRSGQFIERNRVVFKVPVNQTKMEIRQYLRKIYNVKVLKVNTSVKQYEIRRNIYDRRLGYYRAGPMHKRAFITTEEAIPDQVKMIGGALGGSNRLARNPAITKKHLRYGAGSDKSPLKTAKHHYQREGGIRRRGLDVNPHAWKEPIPTLLAGDEWQLNPSHKAQQWEDWFQMRPDPTRAFVHAAVSSKPGKPKILGLPQQTHQTVELRPWRVAQAKIKEGRSIAPERQNGPRAATATRR